jgi:probable rRNA maturation factor
MPQARKPRIVIDISVEAGDWPSNRTLRSLVDKAVTAAFAEADTTGTSELSVVFADDAQIRMLNAGWRGKDKPTNVLSFPASPEELAAGGALGDLVVCAPVVGREAREQGKTLGAHWAHMVVHGTLHLLGFDHEKPRAARAMEALEVEILRGLGYQDPYLWSPKKPYE